MTHVLSLVNFSTTSYPKANMAEKLVKDFINTEWTCNYSPSVQVFQIIFAFSATETVYVSIGEEEKEGRDQLVSRCPYILK